MGRTTSESTEFWAYHVEQYRHGELTPREYYERHGLISGPYRTLAPTWAPGTRADTKKNPHPFPGGAVGLQTH